MGGCGNGKREERGNCSWYAKFKKLITNKITMKYHIALKWLKLKTINSCLAENAEARIPSCWQCSPWITVWLITQEYSDIYPGELKHTYKNIYKMLITFFYSKQSKTCPTKDKWHILITDYHSGFLKNYW